MNAAGRRPPGVGLSLGLALVALLFLAPLYVMVVTSLKSMDEVRLGGLFALPAHATFRPWLQAWSAACTGLRCDGLRVGFWNSVCIVVPASLGSMFIGAVSGYALALWQPRGGRALFTLLLLGAFVPYPALMFPLVRALASVGLYGTLGGIVGIHIIFGMPLMTLLFRNHYAAVPREIFMAARIDGAGFWRIFGQVMLPLSVPAIVAAMIIQVTNIWNDFLLGLVFAGRDNLPMTVQLNNIFDTTTGERLYNVDMAATLITSFVPLAVYALSLRWLMRGVERGVVRP